LAQTGTSPRSPRDGRTDRGFTIIELMVALLVFFIAVPSITYSLITTFDITAGNRARVLAADLLSQSLDAVRSMPFANVPLGNTTTTQTVENETFTISQEVQPIAPPEQSTDVCGESLSGTGSDDYLLVSLAISWPSASAATATPVMGRTMLAPPATVIASGDAEVIIQAFSADGNSAVGVPVTINTVPAQTFNTNNYGCATFPYLNPGQSYTLTATGYVGPNQQAPATLTTPVLALDQTYEQTTGITWDLPTTLTGPVQTRCLSSTGSYIACPSTTDIIYPTSCTAASSPCSGSASDPVPVVFEPTGTPSALLVTGASGPGAAGEASITGFPFYSTNYEAWAGTCADAQPAAGFVEGLTAVPAQAALIWPGNPAVTIFAQALTASSYGHTVTATHASDADCTNGETYSYTVPASLPVGDTVLAVAVPAGTHWSFERSGGTPVNNVVIPPTSTSGLAL